MTGGSGPGLIWCGMAAYAYEKQYRQGLFRLVIVLVILGLTMWQGMIYFM